MKRSGIIISILAAFILFISISCKKESFYMTDATITGFDMRSCACCGGLKIVLNGETDFRLIGNTSDLGIKESESFPISVKVDWEVDKSNNCNHILITKLKKL